MATTTGYEYKEEVYTNLVELSQAMGLSKPPTKKEVTEGKYADVVNVIDLDTEDAIEVAQEEQSTDAETKQEATSSEETDTEESNGEVEASEEEEAWEDGYPAKKAGEDTQEEANAEDVLEVLGEIESLDEFKEFFKDLDTDTAVICVNALDLEIKPTDNPNIYRMRLSMALQRHLFPEHFKPKKSEKKTKYGDYSTEELEAIAKKNKVEFENNPHEGIHRMRLIMALKKSGHLVESK